MKYQSMTNIIDADGLMFALLSAMATESGRGWAGHVKLCGHAGRSVYSGSGAEPQRN
jgi:hypothetical protein